MSKKIVQSNTCYKNQQVVQVDGHCAKCNTTWGFYKFNSGLQCMKCGKTITEEELSRDRQTINMRARLPLCFGTCEDCIANGVTRCTQYGISLRGI